LEGEVLSRLIDEYQAWAALKPHESNARFYQMCGDAVSNFLHGEPGMTCERLLVECYEYPSGKYETKIDSLLALAGVNWEIDPFYDMRDNRLEISAIGVQTDSLFYQTLQDRHRISPAVVEQREDYVPILRTEHGISLAGLKNLPAYANGLRAAVLEEQRYDTHFFSDRRWVTHLEFGDEDPEEIRRLYLFSAAEILGWVWREPERGYVESGGSLLGRSRREAFLQFSSSPARLAEIEAETHKQDVAAWRTRLKRHIEDLQSREQEAVERRATISDQVLSVDIYEVHAEIRALRNELQRDLFAL
jgi:hypothetical protein